MITICHVRSVPRPAPVVRSFAGALVSSRRTQRLPAAGARTLDDPNASRPPHRPPGADTPPPGLRAQASATRNAATSLIGAHIDLAKTEAGEIAGHLARAAALGAIALVLLLLTGILIIIGTTLWLAEWLFGSLGWGVLHGALAFVSIAMAVILVAVGIKVARIGRALVVALVVGLVMGIALGLDLLNRLYAAMGDASGLGIEPGVRPLVIGMILIGLLGLLAGIVLAVRTAGSGRTQIVTVLGATVVGVLLGAFTAITFGPQVGAALGVAIGFASWMGLMGAEVSASGVDVEALKNRFYPSQTIDTSKETLEWLKKQMPPGIGS